jgi:cell division protein FtsN
MTGNSEESGFEFALDSRRLIIGFLVLISFCGCCFIFGFYEGKRQGYREASRSSVVSSSPEAPLDAGPAVKASEEKKTEGAIVPEEQPLDWYKSVNRMKEDAPIEPPKPADEEKPKAKTLPPAAISYSVQVGAFRQKHEVDVKAQALKSKGFDYRIEPPSAPGQLYLLKVGKYPSRADAVAMTIRLKKNGFTCFIKTDEQP